MKKAFLFFSICCLLSFATPALAQTPPTDYRLLAPIPQLVKPNTDKSNAEIFLPGLVKLIIALAGALAVVMIIWGGIQYMSTDAFQGKNEAKNTIQNALWGLLLAISAWLILNTLNPALLDFNLNIPEQKISATPPPGGGGGSGGGGNCAGCQTVAVDHKQPPLGCALPGPCVVVPALNAKLISLKNAGAKYTVTEAFPPTRTHEAPCHQNGQCVDATLKITNTPANIKDFIQKASGVGLRAEFEVLTEARAYAIRNATGLTASQVKVVPGITGEHFSIYMQ